MCRVLALVQVQALGRMLALALVRVLALARVMRSLLGRFRD
jgi:hypothetical protein